MMFSKAILFFGAICLIQGYNCETVLDVVAEFKPKVTALRSTVQSTIAKEEIHIRETKLNITIEIVAGRAKIISKVANVTASVIKIVATSTKNLTLCAEEFHGLIKNVSTKPINKCNSEEDIHAARARINNIWSNYTTTFSIINDCVKKFPNDTQVNNLRECLNKKISAIKADVSESQAVAESKLAAAKNNSTLCIKPIVGNLETATANAYKIFEACAKKAT